MAEKERVQFDFDTDALQRLDEVKDKTEAATRAEVIRNALKVYEWFVNEAGPDSEVTVKNSNGKVILKIKTSILIR